MNWDRKNKDRLHRALQDKKRSLGLQSGDFGNAPTSPKDEFAVWYGMLVKFDIKRVERPTANAPWEEIKDPHICIWSPREKKAGPARSRTHIIVEDPFFPLWCQKGLSIPKDTAEKFLVLGIP